MLAVQALPPPTPGTPPPPALPLQPHSLQTLCQGDYLAVTVSRDHFTFSLQFDFFL